jgi:hypothetical protein
VVRSPGVDELLAVGPNAPGPSSPALAESHVTSDGDVVVGLSGNVDPSTPRYAILGFPNDVLWTSSLSGGGTGVELGGTPLANVVEVTGGGAGTVVTFHFRTAIQLGLEASWVEVPALAAVVVVLTYRRSRWRRAKTRPSTPASPPGATPPGPAQ